MRKQPQLSGLGPLVLQFMHLFVACCDCFVWMDYLVGRKVKLLCFLFFFLSFSKTGFLENLQIDGQSRKGGGRLGRGVGWLKNV